MSGLAVKEYFQNALSNEQEKENKRRVQRMKFLKKVNHKRRLKQNESNLSRSNTCDEFKEPFMFLKEKDIEASKASCDRLVVSTFKEIKNRDDISQIPGFQ